MANIYLTSFSTTIEDIGYQDGELKQIRLRDSFLKFGGTKYWFWNRQKLLKTHFYSDNKKILDNKKGAGLWLWKPFVIYDSLLKINNGEILIYADSSYYFVNNVEIIAEQCEQSGFAFYDDYTHTLANIATTKLLDTLDCTQYRQGNITIAGFLGIKKSEETMSFILEWMKLCQNEQFISDVFNHDNSSVFKYHKHDMTLLSCLVLKYGFKHHDIACVLDINEINNDTVLVWDKLGIGCKRPLSHFFNINKLLAFIIRKIKI